LFSWATARFVPAPTSASNKTDGKASNYCCDIVKLFCWWCFPSFLSSPLLFAKAINSSMDNTSKTAAVVKSACGNRDSNGNSQVGT
jgi:hypothetical protein